MTLAPASPAAPHIFLLLCALLAVVGIRDANPAADDTAPSVRAIITLIANPYKSGRPHVRVADHALAIALLAETANGDSRLLPTHDEIGVMLGLRGKPEELSQLHKYMCL